MVKKSYLHAFLILCITFMYAFIRYVVVKDVDVAHAPLFIFNKAFSITAVILIFLSVFKRDEIRKYYGRLAVFFSLLHVMISLIILNPAYFPKIYSEDGTYKVAQAVSLLMGAVTIVTLFSYQIFKIVGTFTFRAKPIVIFIIITLSIHIVLWSFQNWFLPASWPGLMPPITLISFIVAMLTLITLIFRKR